MKGEREFVREKEARDGLFFSPSSIVIVTPLVCLLRFFCLFFTFHFPLFS